MTGKEVLTLVNDLKTAGYYALSINATNLSSGVYFYRISTEGASTGSAGNNFTAVKR